MEDYVARNIVYAICNDYTNWLVEHGHSYDTASAVGSKVFLSVTGEDVKIPKKPKKATTKNKTKGKANIFADKKSDLEWTDHPEDKKYKFCSDFELTNGYPLLDVASGKIIGTITSTGVGELTSQDKKVCLIKGLKV